MSCSCCCSFCISLLVSRPPLFMNGPWGGKSTSLVDGLGSSSMSALTSAMVPRPPLHTVIGTNSSIWDLHITHFFIIWAQLSQAHICPQGLNRTDAFLSEQTRHSSIWKIFNVKTTCFTNMLNNAFYLQKDNFLEKYVIICDADNKKLCCGCSNCW